MPGCQTTGCATEARAPSRPGRQLVRRPGRCVLHAVGVRGREKEVGGSRVGSGPHRGAPQNIAPRSRQGALCAKTAAHAHLRGCSAVHEIHNLRVQGRGRGVGNCRGVLSRGLGRRVRGPLPPVAAYRGAGASRNIPRGCSRDPRGAGVGLKSGGWGSPNVRTTAAAFSLRRSAPRLCRSI